MSTLFSPVLARWTSLFGLLFNGKPILEKSIKSNRAPAIFSIFKSSSPDIKFIELGGEFQTDIYMSRTLSMFDSSLRRSRRHFRNDYEEYQVMREERAEQDARYRTASRLLDVCAAEALQVPLHYVSRQSAGLTETAVKEAALQSILKVAAPNFENVDLTMILKLRETESCTQLRLMIGELVKRILYDETSDECASIQQEIQSLWMRELFNELISRQKDHSQLRVDLLSGAVSMLPGASELLSGLEMVTNVRQYVADRDSWVGILTELRRL